MVTMSDDLWDDDATRDDKKRACLREIQSHYEPLTSIDCVDSWNRTIQIDGSEVTLQWDGHIDGQVHLRVEGRFNIEVWPFDGLVAPWPPLAGKCEVFPYVPTPDDDHVISLGLDGLEYQEDMISSLPIDGVIRALHRIDTRPPK